MLATLRAEKSAKILLDIFQIALFSIHFRAIVIQQIYILLFSFVYILNGNSTKLIHDNITT